MARPAPGLTLVPLLLIAIVAGGCGRDAAREGAVAPSPAPGAADPGVAAAPTGTEAAAEADPSGPSHAPIAEMAGVEHVASFVDPTRGVHAHTNRLIGETSPYLLQHALRSRGGWPMSVFMEPDSLQPFFGGTYFPKRSGGGRKGFTTIMREVHEQWVHGREQVLGSAREVAARVRRQLAATSRPVPVGPESVQRAVDTFLSAHDPEHGGFRRGADSVVPSGNAVMAHVLLDLHELTGESGYLDDARATLAFLSSYVARRPTSTSMGTLALHRNLAR